MSQGPKDTRTPAEKARDTAGIMGSLMHEGYVPNPEDEAIHQMAERGEITTEQLIAIFRERALGRLRKALAVTDKRGIVTELKTPLDERALDRLMLATDEAVTAYQELRLKLQAAREL